MRNAKSDIDLAAATGEFATMAAQLAAIQKPLHSGGLTAMQSGIQLRPSQVAMTVAPASVIPL